MIVHSLVKAHLAAVVSCLVCMAAASGSVNTTYSAFFNNGSGSGGDDSASSYNWTTAIGTSGLLDETIATPNSVGVSQGTTTPGVPIVSGQSTSGGFLFALPDTAPGAMLLHTTTLTTSTAFQDNPQSNWFRNGPLSLAGVTVGSISRLSVFTRPATGSGLEMRFAIRVNGVWYASATGFTQADPNVWEQRILNPGSVLWHSDIFTSGSMLDDDVSDNPLVALNSSDLVTGYGVYVDTGTLSNTAARVRLDSFEIVTSNSSDNDPLVNYAGGSGVEEFKDVVELSDGTVLVAGSAENLDWIAAPKTQLAPLSIPNRTTGRTAFLMRMAPDLQTILGVWHLPAGQALDFRWIKTTNKPGAPTGDIYVSGRCDATNGDYFIAKLDANFVAGSPSGFSWIKLAKQSGSYGDNLGLQAWDVGGDGRVAYVDETGSTIRVLFLDTNGNPMKLADLRGSHWATGVTLDDTNRQAGVGSDFPAATVSGISFPADLRSWNDPDRLAILPDGNGSIKKGTWPMDLFFPVQDLNGGTSGTIQYGYTGYKSAGKYRIGGIAFNRDTNDFSVGFNVQSKFWDTASGIEQPDFEPAVISYSSTGTLKWWSRLYSEVVDSNANGAIDAGETRISSPDQYVDGLAVDHSTSPARLVVNARCHGNNTSNLWQGNKVSANPGGSGFHNQFTGTEGNIHISWIGKFRETDGTLFRSSYLAGYFRNISLTQAVYPEAIHDGWPSHNAGWPQLTSTRAEPGSVRVDASGRVYVVGLGPRMVTTSNAYQKLPKITPSINEGICPWSNFARVFDADLRTLVYSSSLTGIWTYPSPGADPVGADNTDLYGIFPSSTGLLTVGRHRATAQVAIGNPVPVSNVPTWGVAAPTNVSALFARLPFNANAASVTAPVISQAPACNPSPVTGTTATVSVLATDSDDGEAALTYTWQTIAAPVGGSVTFGSNDSNVAKTSAITFTRAGVYTLKVIVIDPLNQTAQASLNVVVSATPTTLAVSPAMTSVNNGSNVNFVSAGTDQFGEPIINPATTWTVSGGGTIGNTGVFSAETVGGPFTVTASSGGLSATAQVTVNFVAMPEIDLASTSVSQSVQLGGSTTRPFRIANLGSAALTWSGVVSAQAPGGGGNITTFQTSSQAGGPIFSWIDISTGSTTLWAPTGTATSDDVSKSFTFPSGFTFTHYGTIYSAVNVCTNGFLTFGNSLTNYQHTSLPDGGAPPNLITGVWSDWLVDSSSWVKWKSIDAETLAITWNNVKRYNSGNRATFQVILKRSGEILVQVKSYVPTDMLYTIGIQDNSRAAGVLATFNPSSAFIPVGTASNFTVRFPVPNSGPQWLAASPASGSISAFAVGEATISFNSAGLALGTHHGTLTVTSNDSNEGTLMVPVTLEVGDSAVAANAPSGLTATTLSMSEIALAWNLEGGGSTGHRADYRASGESTWIAGPIFGAAATSGSVTGLVSGSAYEFRVVATNAAGDSLGSNIATATTRTGLEDWRDQYFDSTFDEEDRANTSDPDRDGLVNLLEYALGADPTMPSVAPAVICRTEDPVESLALQFTRPTGRNDITTIGEYSTGLTDWSSDAALVETIVTDLDNGTEQVTIRIIGSAVQETRGYLRIRVIQP